MANSYFWGMVTVVALLAWVATIWIRAKYGYPLDDGSGGKVHRQGPSLESVAALRVTIAEQQKAIDSLEERVRVLERVVTDEAAKLGDEIERLRA